MSYNTFPTSIKRPDYGDYSEGVAGRVRRTEFEANTISIRPGASRVRRTFTLGWSSLPQADYNTLKAFFSANFGAAFNFTPYGENASILCMFANEYMTFTASAIDTASSGALRWRGSVKLEQILEETL